jgi:cytochrome oxidase Cu insertion factor (SCO1/SenC/PrrC family)
MNNVDPSVMPSGREAPAGSRFHTRNADDAPPPRVPGLTWVLAIGPLAVVACIFVVYGSNRPEAASKPLPIIHSIPEFSLVERSGRGVTRGNLLGRVWIADFIFTSCAGPCPALTRRMGELQAALRKHAGDVRLVSFSVDPTYDTPSVLTRYADRFNADPDLWWFLTGEDEAAMHRLVRDGFLSIVEPGADAGATLHSTSLILVDRQGRIRGRYAGDDSGEKPRLVADDRRLLAERARP